jgi:toxin-antitoxin system PIN domain toxin
VIVPDVNLLLYAELDAHPLHRPARKWWEGALNGQREVGLAPVAIFGFLRIATNRRIFTVPLGIDDAIERVNGWLARPNVRTVVPGRRHLELAFGLLRQLGSGANLTTDVQLAAHALELNAEVYSNDVDFGRFEGLRWTNPLRP